VDATYSARFLLKPGLDVGMVPRGLSLEEIGSLWSPF